MNPLVNQSERSDSCRHPRRLRCREPGGWRPLARVPAPERRGLTRKQLVELGGDLESVAPVVVPVLNAGYDLLPCSAPSRTGATGGADTSGGASGKTVGEVEADEN